MPYHRGLRRGAHAGPPGKLREAAALADDPGLQKYLELRAGALETDDYQPSDLAWMDMKSNTLDIVIGPIETYDDELFGYKAAHEAYVLVKDQEWSERLARYAKLLPGAAARSAGARRVQAGEARAPTPTSTPTTSSTTPARPTPAPRPSRSTCPTTSRFSSRRAPAGSSSRTRCAPSSTRSWCRSRKELIADDQQQHITFDAFFANVMFHEVAHGLGIKNTIDGKGTVREALKEQAGALEEGKADILGLYMVTRLQQQGEMPDAELDDNYVTFLAGILRSIRFGAANAHGRANAARALLPRGARRLHPRLRDRPLPGGLHPACARRWTRWPAPSCGCRATATTRA